MIAALILITLALYLTVYLLAGLKGQLDYPSIYPSRAFASDPSRAVAAVLIPIMAFLLVFVVLERLNRTSPYIKTRGDIIVLGIILFSLFCVLIGLLGVAAVSVLTLDWLHWIAAGILLGGVVFLLLSLTYWDERLNMVRPNCLRWYRIIIAALGLIVGLVLAGTVGSVIIVTAICEMMLTGLLLLYFISYTHESEFPITSESSIEEVVVGIPVSNPPV